MFAKDSFLEQFKKRRKIASKGKLNVSSKTFIIRNGVRITIVSQEIVSIKSRFDITLSLYFKIR